MAEKEKNTVKKTAPKKEAVKKPAATKKPVASQTKKVQSAGAKPKPKKVVKEAVAEVQPVQQVNGAVAQQPQFINPQVQGQPVYIDPATGQPVYMVQNPAGAGMLNAAMYNAYAGADVQKIREEHKKKEQRVYGTTALILALCGAAVFGLGFLLWSFAFNAGNIDPSMFILVILGWISGPLLMIIIPPILWFISLIFGVVGAFKGPKRVISWVGLVISILVVAGGIFLLASLAPTVFG